MRRPLNSSVKPHLQTLRTARGAPCVLALVAALGLANPTASAPPPLTLPSPPGGEGRVRGAVQSLTIEPASPELRGANRQQQVLITGRTTDGKFLDLTHACQLTTDKPEVACISGTAVRGVADGTTMLRVKVGT